MAVLSMDPHMCLSKTMLFAYVSVHIELLLQVYVLANEPPVYIRHRKLSIQYCL